MATMAVAMMIGTVTTPGTKVASTATRGHGGRMAEGEAVVRVAAEGERCEGKRAAVDVIRPEAADKRLDDIGDQPGQGHHHEQHGGEGSDLPPRGGVNPADAPPVRRALPR